MLAKTGQMEIRPVKTSPTYKQNNRPLKMADTDKRLSVVSKECLSCQIEHRYTRYEAKKKQRLERISADFIQIHDPRYSQFKSVQWGILFCCPWC